MKKNTLSLQIEELVHKYNLSYIDAVIDIAQKLQLEVEDVYETLQFEESPIIEKLKIEFYKRNMLKDDKEFVFLDKIFE